MSQKKIWIIIILFSLGLTLVGLATELYLGDEIVHYRFAKNIFNTGERATFDSLYGKEFSQQVNYMIPPLWHLLLAFLWKMVGRVSFIVAQIYHIFYYALLLISTYLLGKEIYGEKEGLYSMISVGTIPMVTIFGILFYVDVPLAALTTLTFLLILKKRFIPAGFGFGLMYFTKLNGLVFGIPFFLTILFQNYKDKWLMRIISFSLAALAIILPDVYWRQKNVLEEAWLGSNQKIINVFVSGVSKNIKGWTDPTVRGKILSLKAPTYGHNSTFLNIKDHIKYFGASLLLLLFLYLIKRNLLKKDFLLWMPTLFYFLFFIFFFNIDADVRYLLPISPFLSVIASRAISSWEKKPLKIFILILCCAQFLGVLLFVYFHRRIPPEIREAIHYIKGNTPEEAIIIYVEYNLTEYTDRRIFWNVDLKNLFWEKDGAIKSFLEKRRIHYLLVKKEKIYDDRDVRHLKGYPSSFINRLSTFSFSELLLDNSTVSLWKLRREGDPH
jgi:4-amino-4-deoxy-L-arabinose transferase-like glycosyltransferase